MDNPGAGRFVASQPRGDSWVIARQKFHLLGSHDTPRILNILEHDQARNRLAVALLLTYVGVPCIYYGDEIGMSGKDSLEARKLYDLGLKANGIQRLRAFYQTLHPPSAYIPSAHCWWIPDVTD